MLGASLAIQIYKPPVTSLEDVLESSYNLIVAEGNSITKMFLNSPEGSVLSRLLNEKLSLPGNLVTDDVTGLSKMLSGGIFYPVHLLSYRHSTRLFERTRRRKIAKQFSD
jgi:hypothetical protein